MKKIGIAVAGMLLASLACSAAQATFFSLDLVHWDGIGSPPTDPAPIDSMHLIIDDSLGGAISNNGNSTGIWTYGVGTYLDSSYNRVNIDIYNDYGDGGFTFTPYMDNGDVDQGYVVDLYGVSVLGGDEDNYYIKTGIYDYQLGDENWARVTIAEIAAPGSVPEPAAWTLMLGGFGLIGGALRQQRRAKIRFA